MSATPGRPGETIQNPHKGGDGLRRWKPVEPVPSRRPGTSGPRRKR